MSKTQQRSVRQLGLFCLTVVVLALAVAVPLGCVGVALRVGGGSLGEGIALGLALALITRTRRPWLIYLALALSILTFVPLAHEWPPGDAWDVHPWHGAPPIVYGYLDGLRTLLYLLGIPWPFARFGHHAPDPIAILSPVEEVPEGDYGDDSEKP